MISQAMLKISMAAIALAPCNAAQDESDYSESDKAPKFSTHDLLPEGHPMRNDHCESCSDGKTKFRENEMVTFNDGTHLEPQEGAILEILDIREHCGKEQHFYRVFTDLELDPDAEEILQGVVYEIPEMDIESKSPRTFMQKVEPKFCKKVMTKDGSRTIGLQKSPYVTKIFKDIEKADKIGGRTKFCAWFEVVKNALKHNIDIFKQSQCTGKWCCFITSCGGCFGAAICFTTLTNAFFGGGGGLGETLCNLFACCGATGETADAATCEGRCFSCDWDCFKCCEGDDGGNLVPEETGNCCDGCDGCDVDCGGW